MKNSVRTFSLCLIVFSFLLAGCGNSANTFESLVRENNYGKAIETYNSSIIGNSEYENSCQTFLEDYLSEKWAAYAEGSISEADFENILTTLSKIHDTLGILPETEYIETEFISVQFSKESYSQGSQFMEEGDYATAIEAFSWVIPADLENFDKAQSETQRATEAYQTDIVQKAKQLISAGNFDEAISTVENAENVIGPTDTLEEFLVDSYTDFYSQTIENAYKDANYVSVINTYLSAIQNSYVEITADMTSTYTNSSAEYIKELDKQAQSAFGDEKDYTSAIAILSAGIPDIVNDEATVSQIEDLISQYKEYIPVSLADLEYTQTSYSNIIGWPLEELYTDVSGNTYDEDSVICACREDEQYVIYNLNYQYNSLTGTIYRPYDSLSCPDSWSNQTTVEIYGDDVLLYEAPDITSDTYDPIPLLVDITGVRNLKIVIGGAWYVGSFSGYSPLVCLAEVMLYK